MFPDSRCAAMCHWPYGVAWAFFVEEKGLPLPIPSEPLTRPFGEHERRL